MKLMVTASKEESGEGEITGIRLDELGARGQVQSRGPSAGDAGHTRRKVDADDAAAANMPSESDEAKPRAESDLKDPLARLGRKDS